MTKIEQFNAIFENPDVQAKAKLMKTSEEVRTLLAENGLNLTKEEMDAIWQGIGEAMAERFEAGELTDNELEEVSGGGVTLTLLIGKGVQYAFIAGLGAGVVGGLVIGAVAVGAIGYAAYKSYKK